MADSPIVNDTITATLAAQGLSQRDIAARTGLSQPTIHRRLKKAEIRDMVERMSQELITKTAHHVLNNHVRCLSKAGKILGRIDEDPTPGVIIDPETGKAKRCEELSESERNILALADKKEHRLGQMMGIFPSNASSITVQNLFMASTQNVILPNVAAALGAAGCAQFELPGDDPGQSYDEADEDVIDVGE